MRITKRQLRRIIKEELAERGWGDAAVKLGDTVRALVKDGKGLFDFASELQRAGFKGASATTSPMSMVTVPNINGKTYVIISKNMAEDPESIIGPYALGPLE